MATKKAPPWKRKKPGGSVTHLSAASKKRAKAAAKKAGRRYPNLIDNMREASRQNARKKRR